MRWCGSRSSMWMAMLAAAYVAAVASVARAQVPGDTSGDGQVDAADLPGLAACMGGPGSTATPVCEAVFPGQPGLWIGTQDAMRQQVSAARNAGCLGWDSPILP